MTTIGKLRACIPGLFLCCIMLLSGMSFAQATDANVQRLQQILNNLGYPVGPIDGRLGQRTRTAIRQYQKDNKLQETGKIDRTTAKSLLSRQGTVQKRKKKPSSTKPPRKYLGKLKDGSTLRLVTVDTDSGLMIKEVGYRFTATKIGVDHVYLKGETPFGDSIKGGVKFQMPVLLHCTFGNSLNTEKGSTDMAQYDVTVTQIKPNKLTAVMTLANSVDQRYKSFEMVDLSLGHGGTLDPKYTFHMIATK